MNTRRGMAATEFVLILPLLVTLLLGCIDYGRFASTQLAVTGAAQAAAVTASTTPSTGATASAWQAAVLASASDELAGLGGYDPAELLLTVGALADDGDGSIRVQVSYPFRVLVAWPGIPETLQMRATVTLPTIRP